MKIPKKYYAVVTGVLMGLCMSFLMSFFISWITVGLIEGFFGIWTKSFMAGFIIAVPIGILVSRPIEKIAHWITREQTP